MVWLRLQCGICIVLLCIDNNASVLSLLSSPLSLVCRPFSGHLIGRSSFQRVMALQRRMPVDRQARYWMLTVLSNFMCLETLLQSKCLAWNALTYL